jgi:NADH-quinone oxidoreductase subunit J
LAVAGFLILAVAAILGALSVVLQRSALYAALSLVGVFAATAVLYLMLSAQFLAVIQLIVYAGAIMVLFIFLSLRYEESGEAEGIPAGMKRMTALLLGGVLTALIAALSFTLTHVGAAASADVGTVQALGLVLYKKYVFPFEVASILLLVAIIGAVAITRRHGRGLEGHLGTEEEGL